MKHMLCCLALLSATAVAGPTSKIEVEFVDPASFSDARYAHSRPRSAEDNAVLIELRRYLIQQGERFIAPDQRLSLRITEVDLAGEREPMIHPNLNDVRLVTDLYPPRISLDYRLTSLDGSELRGGSVELRDLGFTSSSAAPSSDPLRYEKRMLDRWLRREFGQN